MLKRSIPSSGEMLPVVGLGSWIQFDVGRTPAERDPLKEVLKVAREKGGTLIDSSPMYGNAEEVIGDLTSARPDKDQFFYATKVWTTGEKSGISQMEDSLRKMQRKSMDLMQIHNMVDWETHIQTIRKWQEEKRIRYSGITHYTVSSHEELERVMIKSKVQFVQLNYSLRVRHAEQRLLPAAKEHGIATIINEPFEKGELFSLVKGKPLPQWATEYDIKSWAQFFLKFILSHPAVNVVIPGTSNPRHAADNMEAGSGRMPDEKGRKLMADFIAGI